VRFVNNTVTYLNYATHLCSDSLTWNFKILPGSLSNSRHSPVSPKALDVSGKRAHLTGGTLRGCTDGSQFARKDHRHAEDDHSHSRKRVQCLCKGTRALLGSKLCTLPKCAEMLQIHQASMAAIFFFPTSPL